jgi:hypothetical protein
VTNLLATDVVDSDGIAIIRVPGLSVKASEENLTMKDEILTVRAAHILLE